MTRKRQTIEGRRVDALSPWVSLVEVAVRRDDEPWRPIMVSKSRIMSWCARARPAD